MPKPAGAVLDQKPGPSGSDGSSGLERVTVNLVPRAVRAMNHLSTMTGDSKTDTINRALQAYELLQEVIEDGGSVYLRTAPDGELERLRLL